MSMNIHMIKIFKIKNKIVKVKLSDKSTKINIQMQLKISSCACSNLILLKELNE